MLFRSLVLTAGFTALALPAFAQSDAIAMLHKSSANQLGILEYCQGQGFVDGTVVDAQKSAMSALPPSTTSVGDAEDQGKQGTLMSPDGQSTTLSSLASSHGATVQALCQKMGDVVKQAAAQLKQQGGTMMMAAPNAPGAGAGTMPAMPSMPAMPGMNGTGTGTAPSSN